MSTRTLILFSLGFILVGLGYAAFSRGNLLANGYHKIEDKLHSFDIYEKGAHSVYFPLSHEQRLQQWRHYVRNLKSRESRQTTDEKDPYFEFVPQFKATVMLDSQPQKWKSACFQNAEAHLTVTDTGARLFFNLKDPVDWYCSEAYVVLDRENYYFKYFFFEGQHTIDLTDFADGEYADILQNGMKIFYLPDGFLGSLEDVFFTVMMFVGPWKLEDGTRFIEDYWNETLPVRNLPVINLDESEIEDGDYMAIRRTDGVGTMIMVGTGSHTSHTAVAQRINGKLYIMESVGADGSWPPPFGIIKTPYKEWIQRSVDALHDVAVLKLRPEIRAKYNTTAAIEFFNSVQGTPYGYHNFIYGWIDTVAGNYPPPLDGHVLLYVTILFQEIDKYYCDSVILMGLNKRLGTEDLDIYGILELLQQRNITFRELLTVPEHDRWVYKDGKSMVCDVFVLSMYKAGGLFGALTEDIQVTEFTPRDSYMLDFYQLGANQRPKKCQVDNLPYCQLMGKYTLTMKDASTMQPYSHMKERCAAMPPKYQITPANC